MAQKVAYSTSRVPSLDQGRSKWRYCVPVGRFRASKNLASHAVVSPINDCVGGYKKWEKLESNKGVTSRKGSSGVCNFSPDEFSRPKNPRSNIPFKDYTISKFRFARRVTLTVQLDQRLCSYPMMMWKLYNVVNQEGFIKNQNTVE